MQKSCSSDLNINSLARQLHSFKVYLVFIFYIVCRTELSAGEKIACTIPSAELSAETYLQCIFTEDLSQSRKDFTVYHYVNHGNPDHHWHTAGGGPTFTVKMMFVCNGAPSPCCTDAVLDCWWLSGKLDCFTRPGYDFDLRVSDRLKVHLPRVEENQAGTYACQVAGYKPEHLDTCDLKVHSAGHAVAVVLRNQPPVVNGLQTGRDLSPRTTCLSTAKVLGDPASVTCNFSSKEPSGSFVVSHSDMNSGCGSEEYALVCTWVGGTHACEVLPGYVLEGGITNVAKLNIHSVTQAHLGRYRCRRMSASEDNEESCEMRPQSDFYQNNETNGAVIAVTITIICCVIAIVVAIIIFRQRLKTIWKPEKFGERFRRLTNCKDIESPSKCPQDSHSSHQSHDTNEICEVDEESYLNKTAHLLEKSEQLSAETGSSGTDCEWGSDESKKISNERKSLLECREHSFDEEGSILERTCDKNNPDPKDSDYSSEEGGQSFEDSEKV